MKTSDCIHYYVIKKDDLYVAHEGFTADEEQAYAFTDETAAEQLARQHDATVQHLSVTYGELDEIMLSEEECFVLNF